MKFGVIINVKDEVELVERNIHYHQLLGVKCFLVCDRSINSESQMKIKNLKKNNEIVVYNQNINSFPLDSQEFKNRRITVFNEFWNCFDCDWVIVIDADEFIVSKHNDLSKTESIAKSNHLTVNRYNGAFLQGKELFYQSSEPFLELSQNYIISRPIKMSREFMVNHPDVPWIMNRLMPKFMTSIKTATEIMPGFHSFKSSEPTYKSHPDDLIIVHAPFSTLERFEQKVRSMREHMSRIGETFKPGRAWHWRRWVEELTTRELIKTEYSKQFFSMERLTRLEKESKVCLVDEYFSLSQAGSAKRQKS